MKNKSRQRWMACVVILILLLIIIFLLAAVYDYRYGFDYPQKEFVGNQRGEPYELKIPLDEMDFEVYDQYFFMGETLTDPNYIRMIVLPCDVNYYAEKDHPEPVITLKKGTEVCVLPGEKSFVLSLLGYGLQCWPDYQEDWRYGCPFIEADTAYIVGDHPMYYVRTAELEKVAKAFYKVNGKGLIYSCTPWDFPKVITQFIDRTLYDNGAYCPKRWE